MMKQPQSASLAVTQSQNHTKNTSYAPRDVANAPAIKQFIKQRSATRQDSPEIEQWLLNHFYRHVIGNFNPIDKNACFVIKDMQQAQSLFLPNPTPNWVITKFKSSQPSEVFWIDPQHVEILALETKLVEFLNSRQGTSLEGKLLKINCQQALQQWQTEHDLITKWLNIGKQSHHPNAVKLFLQTSHGAFYELLPHSDDFRAEMAYESQHMQHCLGQFAQRNLLKGGYGEHYASSAEAGKLRIFSYRVGNLPRITISVEVNDNGNLSIDQLKGKQNRPPIEKYQEPVINFLSKLNIHDNTINDDVIAMNIVQIHGQWQLANKITSEVDKLYLLQHYPNLANQLILDTPLLQWLSIVHHPEGVDKIHVLPEIQQTLNFAQSPSLTN